MRVVKREVDSIMNFRTVLGWECVFVVDQGLDPVHDKVNVLGCGYFTGLFLSIHPKVLETNFLENTGNGRRIV